jgi:hyperosmotically inducible protein
MSTITHRILMLALAGISSASFAAPVNDSVAYKQADNQAASDYKAAKAACDSQSGNAKDVCVEQAKATRAHSEASAVAQYKNDKRSVEKAAISVANADYDVAKAQCAAMSGGDKDSCLSTAKSTQTAAIDNAKAGKAAADVARTGENCSAMTGADKASCMTRTRTAMAGDAIADSVITSKVKAELVAEPALKSLEVHVETSQGVVNLSGFVPSQAEADKAVTVARNVKGVNDVQNALRVK